MMIWEWIGFALPRWGGANEGKQRTEYDEPDSQPNTGGYAPIKEWLKNDEGHPNGGPHSWSFDIITQMIGP